jgi:hypothetical protein
LKQPVIELWRPDHDCSEFTSSFGTIRKFIQEQAARVMSNGVTNVFVLTEKGDNRVRGYFTLSSLAIEFAELPEKLQKKLPKYPAIGATLLGRSGVDEQYRNALLGAGQKPRLGEFLFFDAQQKVLNASKTVASAFMIIDVLEPTPEELGRGAKDPMPFYLQYGFAALPNKNRTVFKSVKAIEAEFQ